MDDLHTVLNLFQTIPGPINQFEDEYLRTVYHEVFSVNWLRPESAIYNYLLIKALGPFRQHLQYPMLDMGCGDGIFTAILFGGRIKPEADNYGFIDFNQVDAYNNYTGSQRDLILTPPSPIGFGVDLKENAVKNTQDLGIYDEVKTGDVRNLPFSDGHVNSVFCNMVDDIKTEDLPKLLTEVNRTLKSGGFFIFSSPNENFRESLFYYSLATKSLADGKVEEAERALQYDRGRSAWEPRSKSFWEKQLQNNHFTMEAYTPFLHPNILQLWDTGFRPFFLPLVELRASLSTKPYFIEAKKIIVELLKGYFHSKVFRLPEEPGTFAVIVAKKIN